MHTHTNTHFLSTGEFSPSVPSGPGNKGALVFSCSDCLAVTHPLPQPANHYSWLEYLKHTLRTHFCCFTTVMSGQSNDEIDKLQRRRKDQLVGTWSGCVAILEITEWKRLLPVLRGWLVDSEKILPFMFLAFRGWNRNVSFLASIHLTLVLLLNQTFCKKYLDRFLFFFWSWRHQAIRTGLGMQCALAVALSVFACVSSFNLRIWAVGETLGWFKKKKKNGRPASLTDNLWCESQSTSGALLSPAEYNPCVLGR